MKALLWFCAVVFFILMGFDAGLPGAAAVSLIFFGIGYALLAFFQALKPRSRV